MEKQSDGILANTAMPSTRETGIGAVNHETAVSAVTSVTSSRTSYKKYTPSDRYESGRRRDILGTSKLDVLGTFLGRPS